MNELNEEKSSKVVFPQNAMTFHKYMCTHTVRDGELRRRVLNIYHKVEIKLYGCFFLSLLFAGDEEYETLIYSLELTMWIM